MGTCILSAPRYCLFKSFCFFLVDSIRSDMRDIRRLLFAIRVKKFRKIMIAFDSISESKAQASILLLAVGNSRDRKAFKLIFQEFAPRIRAFMIRKCSDATLAEEITQETMVKVWRKAEQFNPEKASVATWIFTIARNVRIDMLRKIYRPEPDMSDPSMILDSEVPVDEKMSHDEEAQRLKVAFAVLPDDQKIVLQMSFFEEKAHGQIADELGIPLGTVKSRIRLAFNRLRKELGEYNDDQSPY